MKPIVQNGCETIVDMEKFLKSHREYAKNPNPRFDVYRKRLEDAEKTIKDHEKNTKPIP